jgi:hypothetical protein
MAIIGSKIIFPSNIGFIANNIIEATIQPDTNYPETLFEAEGQHRSEGSNIISNIWFKNITFNGLNSVETAISIKAGYKILLDTCRFINFTGKFVYFDQVYDS